VAATRRPAERLGKQDLFGSIEAGRAADLLLLAADPLADIRHTRRIERVIARGVVHDPAELIA
jgi:imidazolonepropionase-like amidohydrolase